ncbi:MAG TPA: acetyl-CoA C-acetyltransferase [Dehalococcoidia bacterium]|nr:acetyl-CoA C-acetyltransferase [Dehalococcoidia bacterium]
MREAVICTPLRTPVGRFGGALRDVQAEDLAALVVEKVLERSGLKGEQVDDVIFGHCYPNGETPAMGRLAPLHAGLPVEVPGFQLDRRCGSGLQAICLAAMEVQTGVADVVLAGGVESMSNAEFYSTQTRWGPNRGEIKLMDRLDRGRVTAGTYRYPVDGGMLETAENLRKQYNIPRQEQDEYALRSHQRAVAAIENGKFDNEIVAVPVPAKKGEGTLFGRDEHPRADTTLEKLAALRPVRLRQDPDATVTAGNASGENDAAACCIVTSPEKAAELGLQPLGKLRSWGVAGVHPAYMGIGPVPATKKALERAGLSLADMELIELNEAFAAQVLAVTREWNFGERDFDRTNVNGSGISIGHPVGCTGVRVMATLLNEMERRNAQFALETMCIGGGQGIAAVIERVA